MTKLTLIGVTLAATTVAAGAWLMQPTNPIATGLLAPNRRIDWTQAGAGAIPARTSICTTLGTNGQSRTYAQSVTATQINDAIAMCGNDQTVLLETGTYSLSAGITFAGRSNVTLRGEGPDSTLLDFSGLTSCMGQWANICIEGNDLTYYVGEGNNPPHIVNWTAGYTQGTTQVTLANSSGLSVGMLLVLDQLNDTFAGGAPDGIFVCFAAGCTVQGGDAILARTNRAQHQMVKVVSCSPSCNNAGSTVVTIDRPLHMPNWRSDQSPQAYWGNSGTYARLNGVEDLSIDGLHANGTHNVAFVYVMESWLKHVRILYAPSPKTHIGFFGSPRITVRDSYLYGTFDDSGSSTHYGIEDYGANDSLVENNIVHRRTSAFVRDGTSGAVYAYNFVLDNFYDAQNNFQQAEHYSHAAGNGMILDEGNSGIEAKGDIIHGTSNLFTYFRNYFIGYDVTLTHGVAKAAEWNAVKLYAFQRYYNFIGNVLGKESKHTTYHANDVGSIYNFGESGGNPLGSDARVAATVMRWGNYDTVTGATRWCVDATSPCTASEVPSGDAYYPNPVPPTHTLPASLYLSAKPAWWGTTIPWPAIGPDVTGGNVTGLGGHVNRIPAEECFRNVMTDDTAYAADSSGTRPKHFTCTYPLQ